jgi:predicted homoserine dehydrogenase-like protein
MGGFTNYGLVDAYETSATHGYLPMSLSVDCRLKRAIAKDQPLRYADVTLPAGRTCDLLRAEQTAHFAKSSPARAAAAR